MATLYITDETKALLDKLSESDRNRPLVDVMAFLVEERAKQLGILADTAPSSEKSKINEAGGVGQADSTQKETKSTKISKSQ